MQLLVDCSGLKICFEPGEVTGLVGFKGLADWLVVYSVLIDCLVVDEDFGQADFDCLID